MEWLKLVTDLVTTPFVAAFVLTLASLTVFHHHKLAIVGAAFPVLSVIFLADHGWAAGQWLEHFGRTEEYHLLYNLALLLPGFSIVAYYFEHSGFDARLSKYIDSDAKLLVAVCVLSAFLDNIAAAMIGGVLARVRYGRDHVPFLMLVGVIGASNLGGAPSPIGDTTTVMLFISGVPTLELVEGLVAVAVALSVMVLFCRRHGGTPLPTRKGRPTPVKWALFWPMLGIPGLIAGNLVLDQPGLGLWAGLILGCVIGRERFRWSEVHPQGDTMKGMYFLVVLVAGAGMIPTEAFRPIMEKLSADGMAYALGVLSAFFDNIPLTKFALTLGGFQWGLLAYTVGFGGSALWFGSSAGVALGTKFPELYQTRRWLKPFVMVQIAYLAGFAAYFAVFHGLVPTLAPLWDWVAGHGGQPAQTAVVILLMLTVGVALMAARVLPTPGAFRRWVAEARTEWR